MEIPSDPYPARVGGPQSSSAVTIVADAATLCEPERSEFLNRMCGDDAVLRQQIELLLRQSGPMQTAMFRHAAGLNLLTNPSEVLPIELGRYRLEERIGEGSFGVVYRASQHTPVRRVVAVKVLRPGLDSIQVLRRFDLERQALAIMDHPSIARIFDAGTTDAGRPYFVMELVKGVPITEYCDANCLPIRKRLQLLIEVCNAIQHAHQKGIIHRDIKPSNILITLHEGIPLPKVIDFGIAKATQGELTVDTANTQFQQMLGTPEYMSPEQADMGNADVDTRSDIYSLGVVLYQLLSGKTPFDTKAMLAKGLDELRSAIRHQEPVKPSSLLGRMDGAEMPAIARNRQSQRRKLIQTARGDLDCITLKCLEKDPSRRYETANALASDLLRHLNDEPVDAKPPSRTYRLQKFSRKYQRTLSVVAFVLLILFAASVWSIIQARRATQAQRYAVQEQGKAEQAKNDAVAARQLAENQGEQFRRSLYAAQLNMSAQDAELPAGLWRAADLLMPWQQSRPDLRGWEWYYLSGLTQNQVLTIPGHTGGAWSVAFSPDGTQLAVASIDHRAYVYDVRTGNRLHVLLGHTARLASLAWSTDAKRIATGSADKTVRIWDPQTGALLQTLNGHAREVTTVAWAPDSRRVLSGGYDGTARIWDAYSGAELHRLEAGSDIDACAWNPADRKTVAVGVSLKVGIRLYDSESGNPITQFVTGSNQRVKYLVWNPDGKLLASGDNDHLINIWDPLAGKLLRKMAGHGGNVNSLAWNSDGSRLVSISEDTTMRIWDPSSGTALAVARGHTGPLQEVAWRRDDKLIASASQDGSVKLWDADEQINSSRQQFLVGDSAKVNCLVWSHDGRRLCSCGDHGKALIWDVDTGRQIGQIEESSRAATCADWSPDDRKLAVANGDQSLHIFDTANGKSLVRTPLGIPVTKVAWSPDGSRIAVGGHNGEIKICRADGAELLTTAGHKNIVSSVSWSPDSSRIVSASQDATAVIWDAHDGHKLTTLQGNEYQVRSAAWSPDGQHIIAAHYNPSITLWDATTGKLLADLRRHSTIVESVAWSPDSTRFVSGALDGTTKVWDATSGADLITFRGDNQQIFTVAWSPNGDRIATSGIGGIITIYDAAPGYSASRSDHALPSLNRRLGDNPEQSKYLSQRARIYANMGRWDAAAADIRRVLAQVPQESPARWFDCGCWARGPDPEHEDPHGAPSLSTIEKLTFTFAGQSQDWHSIDPDPEAKLDLSPFLNQATSGAHRSAYVLSRFYSDQSQYMTIVVDWPGKFRMWVNGKSIFEQTIASSQSNAPDETLVPARIGAGWNTVMLQASEEMTPNSPRDLRLFFEPAHSRTP